MREWFKNNSAILFGSIFLLAICIFFKDAKGGLEIIIMKYIFYYMFIYLSIGLLPKNKITIIILDIIRTPGHLLILVSSLLKSLNFIAVTFLLPTIIFFLIYDKLFSIIGYHFTNSIIFYLTLISSSIFIIEFYEKTLVSLIKTIYRKDDENKKNFITNLSKSLMNKNRIRFFTYLIYLIFLIPFSIIRLEDNISKYDMSFLNAAFYSFSTFLAYEKIVQNINLMKVNIKKTFMQLFENSIFYEKK